MWRFTGTDRAKVGYCGSTWESGCTVVLIVVICILLNKRSFKVPLSTVTDKEALNQLCKYVQRRCIGCCF